MYKSIIVIINLFVFLSFIIFYFFRYKREKFNNEDCIDGICCPKNGVIDCTKIVNKKLRGVICESLRQKCQILNSHNYDKEFVSVHSSLDS